MKLGDRLWLWMNKKPPKRHSRYSASAFLWVFAGIMLCLAGQGAVLLLSAIWEKSVDVGAFATYFGITFGLFILMCLAVYVSDRRQGYLDAVHRHQTERWEGRRGRILGKK